VRYPSRVGLSIAAFFSGLVVRGASFEEKVTALYRPWESETAALAPDGRHLAIMGSTSEANVWIISNF